MKTGMHRNRSLSIFASTGKSIRSGRTFGLFFMITSDILRRYCLFFAVLSLFNQRVTAEDTPALPSDWTVVEQNTWKDILAGNLVELGPVDWPQREWVNNEKLSGKFLKTILTDRNFTSRIPGTGVKISGAIIEGSLVLSDLEVPCKLLLRGCRCETIEISGAKFDKEFEIENSEIADLYAEGAEIRANASFVGLHVHGAIDLRNAVVKGTLEFLNCSSDSLFLIQSHLDSLELSNVRLTSKISRIAMTGATVDNYMRFEGGVAKLYLGRTKAQDIYFEDCKLKGVQAKNMSAASINCSGWIDGTLDLSSSKIDGDIDVSKMKFSGR
jgi:hypothetical protein